uniref:Cytochrome b561 domain-containing protein n=1 Tax=Graphocephala atropunctata TaxID=36148 RepID=A0A1B6MBE0_9HEMI
MDSRPNSVSPLPEMAPIAEFDKSPEETTTLEDLPPPPPTAMSIPISEPPPPPETPKKQRQYDEENSMSCGSWCEYVLVVVLSSLLLLASLVLVLFWTFYYRKGYSWSEDPAKQFNAHPTLMIAGFISLSGFSMLLYRISRCCRKIYVKLFHMIFHALAIPCVVLGFLAVFESKSFSDPPKPHFYSMHSWMGFVTMGLFVFQFVVGFFSFIILLCCEGATAAFRAALVPVHASFGVTTLMMAVATCLTGLTQKVYHDVGDEYSHFSEEGIIINALAMVLVALGIIVSYAVRRNSLHIPAKVLISERL